MGSKATISEYRELLRKYMFVQWPQITLLSFLLLTNISSQLLGPFLIGKFIDGVHEAKPIDNLSLIALLFCGLSLLREVITVTLAWFTENIGWRATNALRIDLARHCLNLDLSFHNNHLPGEFIERIDGDITLLSNFFAQFVIQLLSNVILLVGMTVVLATIDWRAGLGCFIFTIVTALILFWTQSLALPYRKKARVANTALFGFIEEHVGGTEDIRANGAINYVLKRFYFLVHEVLLKQRRSYLVGTISRSAAIILFGLGTAFGLGLGYYLQQSGAITIGTIVLIYVYVEQLRIPVEQIIAQFDDFQQASAGFERINELFRQTTKLKSGPGVEFHQNQGSANVDFEQVTFAYQAEQPILKDISFNLPPGKVLGLLGHTGSGKTTIARLLTRLYDPSAGSIKINGHDLREATLSQVRQAVGLVTQEVQLFQATLRDNLTFFDRSIDDSQILVALDELGLTEWVAKLPQGLDTMLASGGGGLSAGEAQLLAFARLFLKNPLVVILDEASSRLDPATERLLERAITKLLSGRSVVIIAHRLDTLERADDLMILENGQVVEYAPRQDLLADPNSRFNQLLQKGFAEVLG